MIQGNKFLYDPKNLYGFHEHMLDYRGPCNK